MAETKMSERVLYEWTEGEQVRKLLEPRPGFRTHGMEIDQGDGTSTIFPVASDSLAREILRLVAENEELRKMPTERLKDFLETFECAGCEKEYGSDDRAAYCGHCVAKLYRTMLSARAEGRVKGMRDALREFEATRYTVAGAERVQLLIAAAERELEKEQG